MKVISVCTSRISTKLAGIPSARMATYPASSLLACDGPDRMKAQNKASHPRGLPKATMHSCPRSIPSRSWTIRAAMRWLRCSNRVASQCTASRIQRGNTMAISIRPPNTPKIVRLTRYRSYSVIPRAIPCWAREWPAPSTIASGPATAKNATVATNVMKVDVMASGSRTPARFIVHIIIGAAPA